MLVDGGWGGDLGTEDAKRHRKLDTAGAGEPGGTERCQGAADARGTGSVPVPGRAAGPRSGGRGRVCRSDRAGALFSCPWGHLEAIILHLAFS